MMEITTTKGFYIGDPAQGLTEEDYDKIWGNKFNYKSGKLNNFKKGYAVIIGDTAFGDGSYEVVFNREDSAMIDTDSGTIAIIPLEVAVEPKNGIVFNTQNRYTYCQVDVKDGRFTINITEDPEEVMTVVEIDTNFS